MYTEIISVAIRCEQEKTSMVRKMEVRNSTVSAERSSTKTKQVEKWATPTILYPVLMKIQKIEACAS